MPLTLRNYPTALSGLTLGTMGLAGLWSYRVQEPLFLVSAALVSSAVLLPWLIKFIRYPRLIHEDLLHPTVSGVLPTFSMTLMMISAALSQWSEPTGIGLWYFAIALHTVLFLAFLGYRVREFQLEHMSPSWFVPPIGIVVAAVTLPSDADHCREVAEIIVDFGLAAYAILAPMMLFRLIMRARPAIDSLPALAIIAAPASLSLAGYLTVYNADFGVFPWVLWGIAILMTLLVYCKLIDLLRLPFRPTFSAYTFPLAISAMATSKLYDWAVLHGFEALPTTQVVWAIAWIESILVTLIVTYVWIRQLIWFNQQSQSTN